MTQPPVPAHSPYGTVCHFVVQQYFDGWLIYRRRLKRRVPKYVRKAFRKFLKCGDPNQGFSVLACPTQHYSRYVAFRCKGRGFCTYCLMIRQRTLAHQLIERVIGNVPVRHAVLCFPPALRFVIGYDKALLDGGFASLAEAMFNHQRRQAADLFNVSLDRIHPGCAEVAHRASANLDTNHHVHGIFPDGVFIERKDGTLEFCRLPKPSEAELAAIAHEACVAFCGALKRRGFWETTSLSSDSVEGVLTLPKRTGRPTKFFGQAANDSEGGVAPIGGAYAFHLFVGNAIEVEERPQLEQLVNYILAPPFYDHQLSRDDQGNIVLKLKRARHDGTTHVVFSPFEFLDRLAELVSRPKANTVRYFGVYAPSARLRKHAVALRVGDAGPPSRVVGSANVCPICGKQLRVVAEVKGNRGTPNGVPPDTPESLTPRDQDRIEEVLSYAVQGRLFQPPSPYTAE